MENGERMMAVTRRSAVRLLAATTLAPAMESFPAAALRFGASAPVQRGTYKDASLPVEKRVKDLLARMTVEEKARQLDTYAALSDQVQPLAAWDAKFLKENASKLAVSKPSHPEQEINGKTGSEAVFDAQSAAKMWGSLGVGAIHGLDPTPLMANTIQQWIMENTRLAIPVLFVEEGLHGYFDGTIFPAPINLAATWNRTLALQTGAAIAAEARAHGVGMILAPVLDLARDPRWGRIEEDFGEDPYLTGQMGLAYVEGAQGERLDTNHSVVAEIKHFAGYGSPESGTNTSPVHIGERELRTVMLKAMEPAVREGHAMAVMAAYPEIDGLPVAANPHLLIDLLRKEWGFDGFVLSDLGAIRHLYDRHLVAATPKDAVCRALNSGVDMQFYDFDHATFQGSIREGLADGTLHPGALDRAVSGVLRAKFLLGLFDRPTVDPRLQTMVQRSMQHLDLSLESARQSMTLLRNQNHLLPLSKSTRRVAVIGPNADRAQYGDYADETKGSRVTALQGLRAAIGAERVAFDEGADMASAVAAAKSADAAILCLGEKQGISGEGFDRSELGLPGNQQDLLEAVAATGVPVVLVLQNGRPLTIDWAARHIPAILEAWYPGEFGGRAIAETIFGDHNPFGRLTVTFPQTVGQLPDFYNYDPSKKLTYIDSDGLPLFPFGFGLSYTTFAYSELAVNTLADAGEVLVSVKVTNTGRMRGTEVAQLYFRENVTSVETPVRTLAGFEHVTLEPGATETVRFRLKREQLQVWNEDGRWVFEPGEFTVWAGGSSRAELRTEFQLLAGKVSA
jgi:beta-glucosidase